MECGSGCGISAGGGSGGGGGGGEECKMLKGNEGDELR